MPEWGLEDSVFKTDLLECHRRPSRRAASLRAPPLQTGGLNSGSTGWGVGSQWSREARGAGDLGIMDPWPLEWAAPPLRRGAVRRSPSAGRVARLPVPWPLGLGRSADWGRDQGVREPPSREDFGAGEAAQRPTCCRAARRAPVPPAARVADAREGGRERKWRRGMEGGGRRRPQCLGRASPWAQWEGGDVVFLLGHKANWATELLTGPRKIHPGRNESRYKKFFSTPKSNSKSLSKNH
jgi:hypothetical protein